MSYIGNSPTSQSFTPAVDYFSGNGVATSFTLSRSVASTYQIEAIVNNVVQNPSTAYTVLNNTITFTGAPSTGTNNVYVKYISLNAQTTAPGQGTVYTSSLSLNSITGTGNIVLNAAPVISNPTITGTATLSNGTANGLAFINGSNQLTSGSVLAFNGTQLTLTNTSGGDSYIYAGASGISATYIGVNTSGSTNGQGAPNASGYVAVSGGYPLVIGTNGSERVRVTSAGYVGVGNSTPSEKLHVAGNVTVGAYNGNPGSFRITTVNQGLSSPVSARHEFGTDNTGWQYRIAKNAGGTVTDLMTVTDGGYLGIGTTSPRTQLDVPSFITTQLTYVAKGASTTPTSYIGKGTGDETLQFYLSDAAPQVFFTSGTERLRLDAGGNLKMSTANTQILNSSGRPILNQSGSILQVVNANFNNSYQTSTTGTTYLTTNITASITPMSTSSRILVIANVGYYSNQPSASVGNNWYLQLQRGGSALQTWGYAGFTYTLENLSYVPVMYIDSPGSTSAQTYTLYYKNGSSSGTTIYINYGDGGGNQISGITLMEIAA